MAPSNYAMDYLNSLPGRAVPEKSFEAEKSSKVNRRLELLPPAETPQRELSLRSMLTIIVCTVIVGCILAGAVWMSAKQSAVKCEINSLYKQNETLENEITLLETKLLSANSIVNIAEYAAGELDMIYPTQQQYVYISTGGAGTADLVKTIKEKAYL